MKAAVFYEPGVVKVEEKADPVIHGDEVLIRVMAAGICGTDLHIYDGAKGASECFPPVVLGHEFAGVVEAVGEDVVRVKVGDHVEKGQQIGLSGTTGRSTGNHLHFQVEENGVAVNPLLYLEGNGTSSELQRMDPMKDIVSGTKVVLEKKDIETSGEDAQNAAVEETEAAESIAETDSQKQQKETAVETAEIVDSAKQVVDKAVKTEKKTIK